MRFGGDQPERQVQLMDRRQRAREAFADAASDVDPMTEERFLSIEGCVDIAIEAATRVRITPEALACMDPGVGHRAERLTAALVELGFEVEA
jgi:hypothetical protein